MAHRALTGILLVGGASSRFGSPKALARFDSGTLAERAWRLLDEVCDERVAVGRLREGLPFPSLADEGTGPVAAIAAGLRDASHEVAVVIPVDMPLLTVRALMLLAEACRDAAVAQAGPLPCAVARRTLPAFEAEERRLRTVLDGLDTARIELEDRLLANVNSPSDLDTLTRVSEAGVLSRREVRLEPGETRLAAIMFLDMVGFTELARVLPTHQLSTLIDRTYVVILLAYAILGFCYMLLPFMTGMMMQLASNSGSRRAWMFDWMRWMSRTKCGGSSLRSRSVIARSKATKQSIAHHAPSSFRGSPQG